ncbi:MAG: NAD(P)/FAD-dependent oxidoreductase [Planctomycetes bacterium]|nr:NAD(P)/FAD-dependent oxidoreductase [Planctomycetota bacterium]
MYDTIIIGAGMSGLAAGIRLAYYDQRVCILERHYTIGGLNSFYRLRGRDYDVGLHALTNVTPKGTKTGPLARLLRQLRLRWDDFAIAPQLGSEIAFPGVRLRFDNDLQTLHDEIAWAFPREADNFDRLSREIVAYDELSETHANQSAREVVSSIITEPLLVEMLFCPLMFYGSAREHDMDWGQFSIMFRSIFLEGLGRPAAGVRLILKHLVRKFRALGGELKLRSGVKRLAVENGRVTRVILENDEELEARNVVSSAGWCETMRLCDDGQPVVTSRAAGQLSFCETIATLDRAPSDLGHNRTITFFNDHDKFVWQKPDVLCDVRSGVICTPNNFAYDSPLDDGTMRITALANFDRWRSLDEEAYRVEKLRWYDRITESGVRFVPDYRGRVVETDMFTPTTIVRYTGHDNGAVYGAPEKQLDGRTHLENLFVCGTDQGFVGIIGSITSGIAMANRHCLRS